MKSKSQKRRLKTKEKQKLIAESTGPSLVPDGSSLSTSDPLLNTSSLTEDSTYEVPSKLVLLASKYDHLKPADPLYEMHQSITNKLKRKLVTREQSALENSDTVEKPEPPSTDLQQNSPPSKKQLRRATKPSLTELKTITNRPELVEWFDCDAKHPEFLVHLKTLPHVVQVPANWRNRQEIPQFGPKPNYELPEAMKQTRIQELRVAQAEQARSSRDLQQTQNQKTPHVRLDLDYELMYSAFFGSKAVYPITLLSFGEIVDLKLRKVFKPSESQSGCRNKATKTVKPTISKRLRAALGIGEHDPAPWQAYIVKHGLAPGFACPPTRLWGEFVDIADN